MFWFDSDSGRLLHAVKLNSLTAIAAVGCTKGHNLILHTQFRKNSFIYRCLCTHTNGVGGGGDVPSRNLTHIFQLKYVCLDFGFASCGQQALWNDLCLPVLCVCVCVGVDLCVFGLSAFSLRLPHQKCRYMLPFFFLPF